MTPTAIYADDNMVVDELEADLLFIKTLSDDTAHVFISEDDGPKRQWLQNHRTHNGYTLIQFSNPVPLDEQKAMFAALTAGYSDGDPIDTED